MLPFFVIQDQSSAKLIQCSDERLNRSSGTDPTFFSSRKVMSITFNKMVDASINQAGIKGTEENCINMHVHCISGRHERLGNMLLVLLQKHLKLAIHSLNLSAAAKSI